MSSTEAVVRKFYDTVNTQPEIALGLVSDHVKWTEADHFVYYQGELNGKATVIKTILEPVGRDVEHFKMEASTFITEGEHTAAFGLYTGRVHATGANLHAQFVHLFTVRDSSIVEFRQFTDTAAWIEALKK